MDIQQLKLATLWFAVALTFLGAALVALSRHARSDGPHLIADGRAAWLDRPALLAAPFVMVVVSLTVPQPLNAPASLLSSVSLFASRLTLVPEGMTQGLRLFRILALVSLALTFEAARAWVA